MADNPEIIHWKQWPSTTHRHPTKGGIVGANVTTSEEVQSSSQDLPEIH